MIMLSFSIGEMIRAGWRKFTEHPFTWIFSLLLIALILVTHPFVNNWILGNGFIFNPDLAFADQTNRAAYIVIGMTSLLYFLIQQGLSLGLIYMGLRAAEGLPIHFFHLFYRFQYVFHYLIAQFLYGLIILAGLILFVVPAAMWSARFGLYPYFIIDHGAGPIQALKMSSRATEGAKWDIFGFILVSLSLFMLALVPALLGLFVIIPVLNVAWASIYRRLTTVEIPHNLISEMQPIAEAPTEVAPATAESHTPGFPLIEQQENPKEH
jgi:hypothetical protein